MKHFGSSFFSCTWNVQHYFCMLQHKMMVLYQFGNTCFLLLWFTNLLQPLIDQWVQFSIPLEEREGIWTYHYLRLHNLLKNLAPFFAMPVPARTDLLSGRHFNSLRTENRLDRAGDTSPSFILLHEMTASLCKSIQDRTTDSKPSVVTSEQPSSERNFTLLQREHMKTHL